MTKTMTDKSLELAVYVQLTAADLIGRARERLAEEDGQTAAEYLGIILVVVAIIAAIAATNIGTTISGKISDAINAIKAG